MLGSQTRQFMYRYRTNGHYDIMTYHTCMGLIWLDGIDSNLLCQHRIGQFRKVQLWYLRIHKEHESVIQVHCMCLYLLQTKLYLSVFDSFSPPSERHRKEPWLFSSGTTSWSRDEMRWDRRDFAGPSQLAPCCLAFDVSVALDFWMFFEPFRVYKKIRSQNFPIEDIWSMSKIMFPWRYFLKP